MTNTIVAAIPILLINSVIATINTTASTEGRHSGIIIIGDSHKKKAVSLKSPINYRYNARKKRRERRLRNSPSSYFACIKPLGVSCALVLVPSFLICTKRFHARPAPMVLQQSEPRPMGMLSLWDS